MLVVNLQQDLLALLFLPASSVAESERTPGRYREKSAVHDWIIRQIDATKAGYRSENCAGAILLSLRAERRTNGRDELADPAGAFALDVSL
jgi:hypothetical protein